MHPPPPPPYSALGVCIWMHLVNGTGNSPSPGQPTPRVAKQDTSSGGSVDTTKTRVDPQRVRMSSGERAIGAAKGKPPNTEAVYPAPPPPDLPNSPNCSDELLPLWILPNCSANTLGFRDSAPQVIPYLRLAWLCRQYNHLEERLLDQAQARASYTPLFWGHSRSIPQGMILDVQPLVKSLFCPIRASPNGFFA